MALPALYSAMNGFEPGRHFQEGSEGINRQVAHAAPNHDRSQGQPPNAMSSSVIMDAFAHDLGGRMDSIERHVLESSCKLEQMIKDMDQRLITSSNDLPDKLSTLQLTMDKFGHALDDTCGQVEQLNQSQAYMHESTPAHAHGDDYAAPSFGITREKTQDSRSAPSFGEEGGDELDGVMLSMEHEHQPQWLDHVERHLQQIHGKIEEMCLKNDNMLNTVNTVSIKLNTVNNKINDKLNEPLVKRKEIVEEEVQLSKSEEKLTSAPRLAVLVDPGSPEQQKKINIVEQSPAAAKPNSETSHRNEMVHALHKTMGMHARMIQPHRPAGREQWQAVADNHWFKCLSVFAIVVNCICVGLETHFDLMFNLNRALMNEDASVISITDVDRTAFRVIDTVFILLWSLEIGIYGLSQGSGFLCRHNPMLWWNAFDICCTVVSALELTVSLLALDQFPGASMLRLLHIFRVIRVLRIVKVFKSLQGVRKLLIAVNGALTTLFFALFLLALLLYVFSIMVCSALSHHYSTKYKFDEQNPAVPDSNVTTPTAPPAPGAYLDLPTTQTQLVEHFYGTVFKAMATFFQAITGGDWTVSAVPVLDLSWIFYVLWYSYIGFVLFGLLNVFTGIFVESATHAANADRQIKIQAAMEEESSYLNQLRIMFARSDGDNSGQVTEEEMKALLAQKEVQEQLECLGIHSSEADGLFKLLDDDGSGSVSVDEFLSGCVRLKGSARAVDMVTLLFETAKMRRQMERLKTMISDMSKGRAVNDEQSPIAKSSPAPQTCTPKLDSKELGDAKNASLSSSISVTSF